MNSSSLSLLAIAPLILSLPVLGHPSNYSEFLEIHTLPNGVVAAHFTFNQFFDLKRGNNYGHFPRPLVELQRDFGIKSLRVALRRGRWHYQQWGVPPARSSSIGAEVETELFQDDQEDIRTRWKKLCATLSGLFCTSLNLITERNSISPQWNEQNRRFRLHGQLTTEAVCTENLTPWAKLLPCATEAGLASLLSPLKIFSSSYHQFDITLDVIEDQLYLKQQLLTAFNLAWYSENGSINWTLEQLFGQNVRRLCPAASEEDVHLIVHDPKVEASGWKLIKVNDDGGHIDQLEHRLKGSEGITATHCIFFNLNSLVIVIGIDLGAVGATKETSGTNPVILEVDRSLTGVGQERGGLGLVWRNKSSQQRLQVRHTELIPDFLHLFLSQATLEGVDKEKIDLSKLSKLAISPAGPRAHPTELEMEFILEPSSSLLLHIPFEKEFLRYTDFPFDANRGFDLAGAVISYYDPDDTNRSAVPLQVMTTEKLLITMPTPDFTMPYNVITLTSTVIVLFYGTLFNVCYRRFYPRPTPLQRLSRRLIERLVVLRQRILKFFPKRSFTPLRPTTS